MKPAGLEALSRRLGLLFRNEALLRQAFTHPSAVQDRRAVDRHNQRLEFLGDAVVGMVLTHALYDRFPEAGEGVLTKARAGLVNRQVLARLALKLGLGEHLMLGPGEERQGGRQKDSILGDALEALVGALYLDQGFDAARDFVLDHLGEALAEAVEEQIAHNPKGMLQELLQARSTEAPAYTTDRLTGPDHDRLFECSVHHAGRVLGRGQGPSKRVAEAAAALEALKHLQPGSSS